MSGRTPRRRALEYATLILATAAVGWFTRDVEPRLAFVAGALWAGFAVTILRWFELDGWREAAVVYRRALIDLYGSARFLRSDRWRPEVGHDDDVYVALAQAEIVLGPGVGHGISDDPAEA